MTQTSPLTERDREILDMLLSVEFPGVEELRVQARSARIKERWGEGDPSIGFEVPSDTPQADVIARVPVEAPAHDAEPPMEVLLFVDYGFLSMLELVVFGDAYFDEFPPPDWFGPPKTNERWCANR